MTDRLKIDIPVILPDVADAADACVGRLITELKGHDGVSDVHVAQACRRSAIVLPAVVTAVKKYFHLKVSSRFPSIQSQGAFLSIETIRVGVNASMPQCTNGCEFG